ncbi:hypothetical protein [Nonomuraea sp. NPDC048916]|uniref:hypothetical protein n=1 Tax=Nonomuraea sp. NPDC048916 TaxID=3154232 RepID=UPI003402AC53
MDSGFLMYASAVALSGFAATLVPGVASWSIPVTIGLLANSPGAMAKLATNYETAAQQLAAAHTELGNTKNSGSPKEWDAADRDAFDKSVAAFMEQVTKAKDIVHSAGQTMRHSSTASQVCAYFCVTAAGVMLMAAYAASAAATAGPGGLMSGQLAAQGVAARVLTAVSEVLKKQGVVYGMAGGTLVMGAGWHLLQLRTLQNQVNKPEEEMPNFTQVSLKWAPDM